ncbi:MAG: efflux RND transporter permease subunit [Gammaproteobacteria bacterium]|nr:efflux RND transporter permease subunit [Gammaproteobacteria bacterium]MDH5322728.1 efflux RND transporter permease subunit [Gammaproteobacteria bacterium]
MKTWAIRFATERPKLIYTLVLLAVVVLGAFIARIQIDTDPENMLPATQADRLFHNAIEDRFTLHDAIVIGMVNEKDPNGIYNVASLAALHSLTQAILALDGVIAPDLMSLAVTDNIDQQGPGTIRFEWMMRDAPATSSAALEIRDKVSRLPLLLDTLVSGDGKAAAIYVPIASKDLSYPLSIEIRALMDKIDTDDAFHITGLPVAEDTFGHDMFVQMGISAPLAGLMIYLLMLYFFRSVPLVIVPMLVALATIVMTMGLMIGSGFTVHIMSSMIPIFLMPIAVVDSVHVMSEFADRYRPGDDARQIISEIIDHLFTPMLFTSLTSAVGFLSLLLTPIPPVQIFGAFVAFGILLAFVLTIVLIPAYVVRMNPAALAKLAARSKTPHTDTLLARLLRLGGRFAIRRAKLITGITVLLIAISIAGVSRIDINDNPVRWFKANNAIRVADRVLNEHFAGTYDAFFVLTHRDPDARSEFIASVEALLANLPQPAAGLLRELLYDRDDASDYYGTLIAAIEDALFAADAASVDTLENVLALAEAAQRDSKYFQRPDILQRIADIQRVLADSGYVGKTNALTDVVKVVNRELRGGSDDEYRIPATAAAVAQTLLQYQSSHRPQDLWHMVTPDFSSTAIWLQIKSGDNQDMSQVVEFLDNYLAANPLPANIEARWAGKTFINVVWQNTMVSGMLMSLLGAFAFVFVMMAFLFRNPKLGLLAMVPLSVTILGAYGLIGWIGKDYDMPIAVLSSLTLGLSVDFAIHFIERTRDFLRSSGSFEVARQKMMEEPARAIARNAIVIAIGFTPLFFAPLVPYITVGAFMAGIMTLSGVTTLFLLPALISLAGPWLFQGIGRRNSFAAINAEEKD